MIVLFGACGFGVWAFNETNEINSINQKKETTDPSRKARATEIRTQLDQLAGQDAIHTIDYENRVMRVDPLVWAGLSIETKQQLTQTFYNLYQFNGQERSVKILSSRSDKVFADYSPFSGMTIRE